MKEILNFIGANIAYVVLYLSLVNVLTMAYETDNKIILLCIHAAASISALWIVINHLKN